MLWPHSCLDQVRTSLPRLCNSTLTTNSSSGSTRFLHRLRKQKMQRVLPRQLNRPQKMRREKRKWPRLSLQHLIKLLPRKSRKMPIKPRQPRLKRRKHWTRTLLFRKPRLRSRRKKSTRVKLTRSSQTTETRHSSVIPRLSRSLSSRTPTSLVNFAA